MVKAFIDLVQEHQYHGMKVAEIGCYDGESSQHWVPMVSNNSGRSLLVDHFRGSPCVGAGNPHDESSYNPSAVVDKLLFRMRSFQGVTILMGDSVEVADMVKSESLDLCFIDADHRYSKVSQDIDAWKSKVKAGGILCGHDCDALKYDDRFIEMDYIQGNHHGVAKAVTERFPNVKLIGDAVWVVEM